MGHRNRNNDLQQPRFQEVVEYSNGHVPDECGASQRLVEFRKIGDTYCVVAAKCVRDNLGSVEVRSYDPGAIDALVDAAIGLGEECDSCQLNPDLKV